MHPSKVGAEEINQIAFIFVCFNQINNDTITSIAAPLLKKNMKGLYVTCHNQIFAGIQLFFVLWPSLVT